MGIWRDASPGPLGNFDDRDLCGGPRLGTERIPSWRRQYVPEAWLGDILSHGPSAHRRDRDRKVFCWGQERAGDIFGGGTVRSGPLWQYDFDWFKVPLTAEFQNHRLFCLNTVNIYFIAASSCLEANFNRATF